jgi:hypothetical protein
MGQPYKWINKYVTFAVFLLRECLSYPSRVLLSLQATYNCRAYVISCRSQGLILSGWKVFIASRKKPEPPLIRHTLHEV